MSCPKPTYHVKQAANPVPGPWQKWTPWKVVLLPKPGAALISKMAVGRFRHRVRTWTWAAHQYRTDSKRSWHCAKGWSAQGDGRCARYDFESGHLEYDATRGYWSCDATTSFVETKSSLWTETQYEWCIDDRLETNSDVELDSQPFWNGSWIALWIGEPPHERDTIRTGCDPKLKWVEAVKFAVKYETASSQPFMSVELRAELPSGPTTLPVVIPIGQPATIHVEPEITVGAQAGAYASVAVHVESLTLRHVLAELIVIDTSPGISAGFTSVPIVDLQGHHSHRTGLQVKVYNEALAATSERPSVFVGLRDPRSSRVYAVRSVNVAFGERSATV